MKRPDSGCPVEEDGSEEGSPARGWSSKGLTVRRRQDGEALQRRDGAPPPPPAQAGSHGWLGTGRSGLGRGGNSGPCRPLYQGRCPTPPLSPAAAERALIMRWEA